MPQYFFVPQLLAEESFRVRLQTGHQADRARIEIFRQNDEGEWNSVGVCETRGSAATSEQHPYFATVEITDVPTEGHGEIYKFMLTDPERSGNQSAGNTWVRFSRNIPPYLSNRSERLIHPIVHREFEPMVYAGETASYRAYPTVDRENTSIVPTGSQLQIKVKGEVGTGSPTDYRASFDYTAPGERDKTEPGEVYANLVQIGTQPSTKKVLAQSTDKIDAIYFVPKPVYADPSWPSTGKVLLAYDNANGNPTSPALDNPGRFATVQTDDPQTLATISSNNMTAMGVLYGAERMRDWFDENTCNPNDRRIQFWAIYDEPDSGPGENGPLTALKDLYDRYYCLKGKTSDDKPFSLNLMHTIFLEEFSKGCDVVSHDPFVKTGTGNSINRIADSVDELVYQTSGIFAVKKTILILWWWNPKAGDPADIAVAYTLFNQSFDLRRDEVDGIGGWNFSSGRDSEGNITRLDTYQNQSVGLLWNAIRAKNASINPLPSNSQSVADRSRRW